MNDSDRHHDRQHERPRRVVVTGPRTRATRGLAQRGVRDLDEQTGVGEVYLRSLMRTQLSLIHI